MSDRAVVPDVVELAASGPLHGSVRPPGDKSISHRSVLLSALAEGRSTIDGLSDGADVAATIACVALLGADVQHVDDGAVVITGGRDHLRAAAVPLDCGNSGTTMRLLCGVTATIAGRHGLVGDASLSTRPMDRVAVPLHAMGASVHGHGATCVPPLAVVGSRGLRAITYALPVASAQVKSAILLAGLAADGPTTVVEPIATRTHTEEMLALAGARISVAPRPDGRHTTVWPSTLRPRAWHVPADPSQGAFFVVAALLSSAAEVVVRDCYVGPERIGYLVVLERMGGHVVTRVGRAATGDLLASASLLDATEITASEIPSLDEVPVLAVAAAAATGTTTFAGVDELRVKESDRADATIRLVRALGAHARVDGSTLCIEGVGSARQFARFEFDAAGDHRMAMAAAVAASVGAGGVIGGFAGVATSYPGFLSDLASLR